MDPKLESPNKRLGLLPNTTWQGIVIHYTAGASYEGSLNWLKNPKSQASAHFIVDRDGDFEQLVGVDNRAWHAGESSFLGRTNTNNFMLGIEIANVGPVILSKGSLTDSSGNPFKGSTVATTDHNIYHAKQFESFSSLQVQTVAGLCNELIELFKIPSHYIVGHENVSYGRKGDPGPAWNWTTFNKLINHQYNTTYSLNSAIQSLLENYGYDVGFIDGIWGKNSQKALERFCIDKNQILSADLEYMLETLLNHRKG